MAFGQWPSGTLTEACMLPEVHTGVRDTETEVTSSHGVRGGGGGDAVWLAFFGKR